MSRGQGRGSGRGGSGCCVYRFGQRGVPALPLSCRLPGPAAWGGWPELQGPKHQGVLGASLGSVYVSRARKSTSRVRAVRGKRLGTAFMTPQVSLPLRCHRYAHSSLFPGPEGKEFFGLWERELLWLWREGTMGRIHVQSLAGIWLRPHPAFQPLWKGVVT